MANENVEITPEDLAPYINRETLTSYLSELIIDIRNSDSSQYSILKQKIIELEQFNDIKVSSKISQLKDAYDKIKEVSVEIRKLLSVVFPQIESYDNINYAIYYKGKRYYASKLDTNWIRKSSKTGNLSLQVSQMAKELQEYYDAIGLSKLQEAFERHLMVYQNAIRGTYHGIIGRGGALNEGHITEAFEAHIQEHHSAAYQLFNTTSLLSLADKSIAAAVDFDETAKELDLTDWWQHENITEAWIHIRNSFGIQKGTAAGDTRDAQVKAIKKALEGKKQDTKIRLERFGVIRDGVSIYCAILDKSQSSEKVAALIVKYIEEPIRDTSARVISEVANKDVQDLFIQGNLKNEYYKEMNLIRS